MGRTKERTIHASVARWGLAAAIAMTASACNMTPDYQRPQQDIPTSYRNPLPEPSPELPRPQSQWWTILGSEELNTLVEEALANNHDLKATAYRIIQAEAQAGSAASALLPTITSSTKRSVDSPQGGQGANPEFPTNRTHRLTSGGLTVSWELDLWGKIRASKTSALASALANLHDREAVSLTLVSDLVLTYIQYLEGLDRETVARSNIANMKAMYGAVRERVRLGESSNLELAQQRNVLAQAEATIPPILLQRERAFNKLAILLGRAPQTLALNGKTMRDLLVPEVSAGLPADLLLRRPDIRKAEANLLAGNANIGVARTRLLPSLAITGDRGWASQLFEHITQPDSIYYTLAASLTSTIFDNGKTQADIDASRGKYDELVEVYQQSILTALRDVEDALMAVRLQGDLEVAQQEVLQASLDAYGLSAEAFRLGMVDYLNVLETQRTRFQAEDAKVQARFGRLEAAIGLYKALGGGMESDEDKTADNAPKPTAEPPAEAVPAPPPVPEPERPSAAPRGEVDDAPIPAAPAPAADAAPVLKLSTEVVSASIQGSFEPAALQAVPPLAPDEIYKTAVFNDNAS